jgi:DNA-binding SARP family transcriptional activator
VLRVRLLGAFEIDGADVMSVRSRKSRTLFKVLALARGQLVSVDRLADCLWGDSPPTNPVREVAVHASRMRQLVGQERIVREGAGYRLLVDWLDVEALMALTTEASDRLARGEPVAARAAADAGLALVRGELLADEGDAEWAAADRAAVERSVAALRRIGAQAALDAGDAPEAAAAAAGALDHDPYDEAALRLLMTAHVAAGRPASALNAYAEARQRLVEELGVSPTEETEQLHGAILRGELPVPATAPPRARPTPAEALPGRTAQIDQLDRAWHEAASGVQVVLVEGEPGAGKSTLLRVWSSARGSEGTAVLWGRCDELGRALPLQPVSDALASHLRGLDREEAGALIEDDAILLGPLIGRSRPARGDRTTPPAPGATPEAMQVLVFEALLGLFRRIAGAGVAVLVLDDVQHAGSSTIEWLRFIRRRGAGVPLLVAVACPTGEGPALDVTRIDVGPLDLHAVTALAGAERAAELLERSGGNALLLSELLAGDPDDGPLPRSIREIVRSRLAGLGGAAGTMQAAAVLGEPIDLDLLASVVERSPIEVLGDLERGAAQGVLDEHGTRFVFRHGLVREALEADVSAARRSLLHRRAATALRERPDVEPLDLAHHARRSGDVQIAAQALVEAAAIATARHALADAERLLDESIELCDGAAARLARGRVRIARSDLDGAEADAVDALGLGAGARAVELRAWIARHRHDMELAIRLGEEAASSTDEPGVAASCLLVMAFAHRGLGDLPKADDELARAVAFVPRDPAMRGWQGVLRTHQGRTDEALAALEPLIGAEVDSAHGFWVEHVLQMAAHARAMAGRPAEALELLDRLTVETKRRGSDLRYQGLDENYRSWILRNLGDPGAREHSQRGLEATGVLIEVRVQAQLDLADDHLRDGDLDEAGRWLADAEHGLGARWFQNRWRCEQRLALLRARRLLAAGEPLAALEAALATTSAAELRGDLRYLTLGRVLVARAELAAGRRIDPASLEADLARLPRVAALEAWWMLDDLAREAGIERWRRWAESLAGGLAAAAGRYEATFRRHLAARRTIG